MAVWTGWLAAALVPLAASIPLIVRLRRGKRDAPTSTSTRWHVVIGMVVAGVAFLHTLTDEGFLTNTQFSNPFGGDS